MQLQTPCGSMRRRIVLFTVLGLVALAVPQSHAVLIHQYQLNGGFGDDLGGPSLVAGGGTVGSTSYTFGANQGLSLSNGLTDPANYSIELAFNFNSLSGYRKILDFKNRSSDNGLYNLNTALNFYPMTTGAAGAFTAGVNARVVVTRSNATDQFIGYVNGAQHIAFTDTLDRAVFSATNSIIQFFTDDFVVKGEASTGVVDLIRIYDTPLSASEVASLRDPVAPVPEPSTLFLLVGAISLLGFSRFRQQRRAGH